MHLQTLDNAALSELKSALQGFLKKGQTLQLSTVVRVCIANGICIHRIDVVSSYHSKTDLDRNPKVCEFKMKVMVVWDDVNNMHEFSESVGFVIADDVFCIAVWGLSLIHISEPTRRS